MTFRRRAHTAAPERTGTLSAPPPATPTELGLMLRAARERRRLSLEEIRDLIDVPMVDLDALERGQLEVFHHQQAAVVALWRYAELVGLEPEHLLPVLQTHWPHPALAVGALYGDDGIPATPVARIVVAQQLLEPIAHPDTTAAGAVGLSPTTLAELTDGTAARVLAVAVLVPAARKALTRGTKNGKKKKLPPAGGAPGLPAAPKKPKGPSSKGPGSKGPAAKKAGPKAKAAAKLAPLVAPVEDLGELEDPEGLDELVTLDEAPSPLDETVEVDATLERSSPDVLAAEAEARDREVAAADEDDAEGDLGEEPDEDADEGDDGEDELDAAGDEDASAGETDASAEAIEPAASEQRAVGWDAAPALAAAPAAAESIYSEDTTEVDALATPDTVTLEGPIVLEAPGPAPANGPASAVSPRQVESALHRSLRIAGHLSQIVAERFGLGEVARAVTGVTDPRR